MFFYLPVIQSGLGVGMRLEERDRYQTKGMSLSEIDRERASEQVLVITLKGSI